MASEMNQQPGWGHAASGPGFTAPGGLPPAPQQPRSDPTPAAQQPPFAAYGSPVPGPALVRTAQRPGVVTVAVVMIITASMLWMAELAMVWLMVEAGREQFGYEGTEGALFHMLERFHLKMVDGMAWALFGFPLAATLLAFFLLIRRAWPRIVISALGVLAIGTTAMMLPDNLRLIIPGAIYILFTCVLLWVPTVTRWISGQSGTAR